MIKRLLDWWRNLWKSSKTSSTTRKRVYIPRFYNEDDGYWTIRKVVWSTVMMHRDILNDVNFCSMIWRYYPLASIFYEEQLPGYWVLDYTNDKKQLGDFGND